MKLDECFVEELAGAEKKYDPTDFENLEEQNFHRANYGVLLHFSTRIDVSRRVLGRLPAKPPSHPDGVRLEGWHESLGDGFPVALGLRFVAHLLGGEGLDEVLV